MLPDEAHFVGYLTNQQINSPVTPGWLHAGAPVPINTMEKNRKSPVYCGSLQNINKMLNGIFVSHLEY